MNIETQAVLFALATPVVVFAAILSAKAENKKRKRMQAISKLRWKSETAEQHAIVLRIAREIFEEGGEQAFRNFCAQTADAAEQWNEALTNLCANWKIAVPPWERGFGMVETHELNKHHLRIMDKVYKEEQLADSATQLATSNSPLATSPKEQA